MPLFLPVLAKKKYTHHFGKYRNRRKKNKTRYLELVEMYQHSTVHRKNYNYNFLKSVPVWVDCLAVT